MKYIFALSILFCTVTIPALSELTVQDLDKIRSIVKTSEQELKEEIADAEKRTKDYISQEIKTINVKIAETDKRLNQIFWWVISLMGLIALAIAAPQALIAWQNRKDRLLEKQVETLTREIETLKQRHIVSS